MASTNRPVKHWVSQGLLHLLDSILTPGVDVYNVIVVFAQHFQCRRLIMILKVKFKCHTSASVSLPHCALRFFSDNVAKYCARGKHYHYGFTIRIVWVITIVFWMGLRPLVSEFVSAARLSNLYPWKNMTSLCRASSPKKAGIGSKIPIPDSEKGWFSACLWSDQPPSSS